MAQGKRWWMWGLWSALSAALAGYLVSGMLVVPASDNSWNAPARRLLLPGDTSAGHHQIELACEACHKEVFAGRAALQEACVGCHQAELREARDSHPKSKFTDPRNAEVAARLDATLCVTCHVEHRPGITHAAGVTLPKDFCVVCHEDVGNDRPTHAGLGFETCASAGCHNFHDNRALYHDLLVKHANDPALSARPRLAARDFRSVIEELSNYPLQRFPLKQLSTGDAGTALPNDPKAHAEWLETAHARSGVNCSGCHQDAKGVWRDKPGPDSCKGCHDAELKGFLAGKHGMRLVQNMAPMHPGDARLPMQQDAHDRSLGCTSCHAAHRFDTRHAAVEGCLSCHADEHSLAYKRSSHYTLWQRELAGAAPPGSGVSCASCHLPRIEFSTPDDVKRILVQHNQNDGLRPNEKMIRPVCQSCHGLPFSIDALADPALMQRNFAGPPKARVKSIDMSLDAERRAERERAGKR